MPIQYFKYLVSISSLEFGRSLYYKQNVTDLIAEKIPNTLLLTIPSLFVTYVLGIAWGMIAAWKRGSRFEQGSIVIILTGRSTPTFWVGMVAISIFCFQLGWFPSSGITSPGVHYDSFLGKILSADFLRHLVLPLVTNVSFLLGLPFLIMRSNMLENINKDFIAMHKFCGLSTSRTVFRAARNSLLPVVTVVALGVGYIFGGAPVIEMVFSWPGVGLLLVNAVVSLDYPLAQACFLLIAASVLFLNFLVDLLYGVLDPRISSQRRFK
jgi:peptide/nickel transport system permease protein